MNPPRTRQAPEQHLCLDEATTEDLLALSERTNKRSTAAQALGALVETGTMSDLEALNRIEDWKATPR
ncbi:MAG: hypothetical protein HS113_28940 [Verrucomicrobiales bacterium]|nr:hypothetical protein [Verrucomicrobiales bacterium]